MRIFELWTKGSYQKLISKEANKHIESEYYSLSKLVKYFESKNLMADFGLWRLAICFAQYFCVKLLLN